MREKEGVILKHLYRVVRLPKGSGPQYQPWHHLWLAVGLTALGIFLGVLTLFLSAGSCAALVEEDLLQHYWSSPLLCYLNLRPLLAGLSVYRRSPAGPYFGKLL